MEYNKEKDNKSYLLIALTLCLLAVVFTLMASIILIPEVRKCLRFLFPHFLGISFTVLGVALIYLTLKKNLKGKLKLFLILTGGCAVGSFISVILHNLIYGLFIILFDPGFWERIGLGDEPFFFTLGLIVFPIGFIIGQLGSIFYFLKRKKIEIE